MQTSGDEQLLRLANLLPRPVVGPRWVYDVGLYTGTRAGAICSASFDHKPGRGWVDLDWGVFRRRAIGATETNKRQPPVRVPDRLLVHLRRWQRLGLSKEAVVQFGRKPMGRARRR